MVVTYDVLRTPAKANGVRWMVVRKEGGKSQLVGTRFLTRSMAIKTAARLQLALDPRYLAARAAFRDVEQVVSDELISRLEVSTPACR